MEVSQRRRRTRREKGRRQRGEGGRNREASRASTDGHGGHGRAGQRFRSVGGEAGLVRPLAEPTCGGREGGDWDCPLGLNLVHLAGID